MRSRLAWPRVLRDIAIILFIATALIAALEIGLVHGAAPSTGSDPPAASAAAAGARTS